MSELITKPLKVKREDGDDERHAQVIACGKCQGEIFQIFWIESEPGEFTHQQLQCVDCGECYCDGSCK